MLFSKQDLRKIIVPLLIEQALAVTVGMLDTVMVASAGEAAVSGVSLVDTLNLLLIYVFSALAGGGAIVISQLLGKGVKETAQEDINGNTLINMPALDGIEIKYRNNLAVHKENSQV